MQKFSNPNHKRPLRGAAYSLGSDPLEAGSGGPRGGAPFPWFSLAGLEQLSAASAAAAAAAGSSSLIQQPPPPLELQVKSLDSLPRDSIIVLCNKTQRKFIDTLIGVII